MKKSTVIYCQQLGGYWSVGRGGFYGELYATKFSPVQVGSPEDNGLSEQLERAVKSTDFLVELKEVYHE
jgi:hypothetical protein